MRPPRKSRGSVLGRLLTLLLVGFVLIALLPQCMQQLGQMAGNAASSAAHQATSEAAGGLASALSRLGHGLVDRIESWWGGLSPAEKFDKICGKIPVEGVDKVCPYFTAALKGASDAEAAETACYMAAAGIGGEAPQTLNLIHSFCRQTDPRALATCVRGYVNEAGNESRCMPESPEQFWREARAIIEPIACPPGLPKSLCTTQSSSQSSSASTNGVPNTSTAAPSTSGPSPTSTRTDTSYLNCLTYYYHYLRPRGETSCGSTITAASAGCARTALLTFAPQGQSVGASQVAQCDALQP
ncbi:MAG TPA: hypothetical protein VFX20_15430 [Steroidobacteraceae bacterium]|nr:hypothetical protein [Steroidobacteraceae bacterium]